MKILLSLVAIGLALAPFSLPIPEPEPVMCVDGYTGEVIQSFGDGQVWVDHPNGGDTNHFEFTPQERPKPKTACYPVTKDKKPGCQCLHQDNGEGCKDGKRDVEMSNCSSYCWKDMCGCCKS